MGVGFSWNVFCGCGSLRRWFRFALVNWRNSQACGMKWNKGKCRRHPWGRQVGTKERLRGQGGELGAHLPSIITEAHLSQVSQFFENTVSPLLLTSGILSWRTKLFTDFNRYFLKKVISPPLSHPCLSLYQVIHLLLALCSPLWYFPHCVIIGLSANANIFNTSVLC